MMAIGTRMTWMSRAAPSTRRELKPKTMPSPDITRATHATVGRPVVAAIKRATLITASPRPTAKLARQTRDGRHRPKSWRRN